MRELPVRCKTDFQDQRIARTLHDREGSKRRQSISALSGISDLDLLREGEGIVYLNPEIAYGAFDPRVPE